MYKILEQHSEVNNQMSAEHAGTKKWRKIINSCSNKTFSNSLNEVRSKICVHWLQFLLFNGLIFIILYCLLM